VTTISEESTAVPYGLIFVYNAPQTVDGDLVALLQQEIVLVFVGRFINGLQLFFRRREALLAKGTI